MIIPSISSRLFYFQNVNLKLIEKLKKEIEETLKTELQWTGAFHSSAQLISYSMKLNSINYLLVLFNDWSDQLVNKLFFLDSYIKFSII